MDTVHHGSAHPGADSDATVPAAPGELRRCAGVGDGVYELRLDFGPGYRIYYGLVGETVVVLLGGGDKRSQARDIRAATRHWQEFRADHATERL